MVQAKTSSTDTRALKILHHQLRDHPTFLKALRYEARGFRGPNFVRTGTTSTTMARAIVNNNSASTLGGELIPFYIDRGQHPRMPLSLPDLRSAGETAPAYATRMKALQQEVQALLHAAQQERKASLDPRRV